MDVFSLEAETKLCANWDLNLLSAPYFTFQIIEDESSEFSEFNISAREKSDAIEELKKPLDTRLMIQLVERAATN